LVGFANVILLATRNLKVYRQAGDS
jgi:hypothetical protein